MNLSGRRTTDPSLLKIARWLVFNRSLSVIPVPINSKKPSMKWKPFQSRRPTDRELVAWFRNGQPHNLAIVTGRVSGVVVVDVDSTEAVAWAKDHLPATPMMVQTARGLHHYYQHPGTPIRNKARLRTEKATLALDVRADGGFVIAPGSRHPSGHMYRKAGTWPPIAELPVFNPAWLDVVDKAAQHAPTRQHARTDDDHASALRRARAYVAKIPPAVEGNGGDAQTFQVCCKVAVGFALTDADAFDVLRDWNQRCVPPWTDRELKSKIVNARQYASEPVGCRVQNQNQRFVAPAPRIAGAPPHPLESTHKTFRRWLGEEYDLDALDAVLATTAAVRLKGDPLWLLLISGSGNAKTETVQSLAGTPGVIVTSTITSEGALLSGSSKKTTAPDATGGLLRRIGEKGVLVIKDVTSILAMDRNTRGGMLAALREIHDQRWERNIGTDGGRTLTWTGRIAIIGAVTTAWDRAYDVIAAMGDRFVILRMDSAVHRQETGRHAMRNTGHEELMRRELASAVASVLHTIDPNSAITLTDDENDRILQAADVVTLCRTGVDYDYRGEVIDAHAPEMPTRFAKQLVQMVRGAVVVGMARPHALRLAIRCARDSMPPLRLEILDDVLAHPHSSTGDVWRRLNKPRMTVDRQLKALTTLGVLTLDELIEHAIAKGVPVEKSRWFYDIANHIDPHVLACPDLLPHMCLSVNRGGGRDLPPTHNSGQAYPRAGTDDVGRF